MIFLILLFTILSVGAILYRNNFTPVILQSPVLSVFKLKKEYHFNKTAFQDEKKGKDTIIRNRVNTQIYGWKIQ
ncbi:hypothetical protein GCM10011346_13220 [Oceanobacillus neutriphilus]|uniref:Uncharacterized protein n=1 Tax=Oceanobacillus neutriphilus TaxID=531815 RepID=A0ABQ2NSY6_9BACI|nr:hypothetical protein GCM10011346_13220 [Oceanobacillus neutriphilus]